MTPEEQYKQETGKEPFEFAYYLSKGTGAGFVSKGAYYTRPTIQFNTWLKSKFIYKSNRLEVIEEAVKKLIQYGIVNESHYLLESWQQIIAEEKKK